MFYIASSSLKPVNKRLGPPLLHNHREINISLFTSAVVSCPAPVVENGVRIEGRLPPYKHKSYVTYKCNDGYEMTGQASLTCEIEGWSASIPTCKGKACFSVLLNIL